MKKFLLMMVLVCVSMLGRAEDMPETLYLCGSMNDWVTPNKPAGQGYKLLDPDGDGTYTASFEFPKGYLSFKIFTAAVDWDTELAYFGISGSGFSPLYSNRTWDYYLSYGSYSDPITIENWEGGTLELKAIYTPDNGYGYPDVRLILNGPEQPALAPLPEKVYLVGDFNNWAVPTASSDNGAYVLSQIQEGWYSGDEIVPPAGQAKFVLCTLSPEDGTPLFYGTTIPPFTITYDPTYTDPTITNPSVSVWPKITEPQTSIEDVSPIEITNWNETGSLSITYYFDSRECVLRWNNCPAVEGEGPRYAIVTADGGEPYVYDMGTWSSCTVYAKQEVSVLFSSENSVNPSPENVWGAPESIVVPVAEYTDSRLVKGGKPYTVEGSGVQPFRATFSCVWTRKLTSIQSKAESLPFEYADMVYINGYINGWPTPTESNKGTFEDYQLTKIAHGIFEGTFYFPEAALDSRQNPTGQFRFFKGFSSDWSDEHSIGSGSDDYTYQGVQFDEDGVYKSRIFEKGLSNWALDNDWYGGDGVWKGGWLKVNVNLIDKVLTLAKIDSDSVESITADNTDDVVYYNMMGQPVKHPEHGIFIRKTASGSKKVYIK